MIPPAKPLRVVGLFSGIGGLEAGLRKAGHEVILLCEKDGPARRVLQQRFPGVPVRDDVKKIKRLPRDVQLVAAGFPCQDLSQCGQTAGIEGKQSGLVDYVFKLLRRRSIPWLLLENVPFMLHLDNGRAMEVIVKKLERLGYKWAYRVVDTKCFGVPQRRRRVFLLASLESDPRGVLLAEDAGLPAESPSREAAKGFYWTEGNRGLGLAIDSIPPLKGGSHVPSPPAIILPSGEVITPDIRDAERLQGFEAGWTKAAEVGNNGGCGHRWRLVGNAVTVHVAEWISKRLRNPRAYDGAKDPILKDGAPWPKAAWNDGTGRHASGVSTWPVARKATLLAKFIRFSGKPLSARATEGFLTRIRKSPLRRPKGFDADLEAHLKRMKADDKRKVITVASAKLMKAAVASRNGAGNENGHGNGYGIVGGRRADIRADVARASAGHRS